VGNALRFGWRNAVRWRRGRQGTGYDTMLRRAAARPLGLNSDLIRCPDGSEGPPHTDPVEHGRYCRLKRVLKRSPAAGEFVCANSIYSSARIKLFRPGRREHGVTRVVGGSRWLLSLG